MTAALDRARAAMTDRLNAMVRHSARNLTTLVLTVLNDVEAEALRPPDWNQSLARARASATHMLELLERCIEWPDGPCSNVVDVLDEVRFLGGSYRGTRLRVCVPPSMSGTSVAASYAEVKAATLLMALIAYAALPHGGTIDLAVHETHHGIELVTSVMSYDADVGALADRAPSNATTQRERLRALAEDIGAAVSPGNKVGELTLALPR